MILVPVNGEPRLLILMILRGYFDDSGSHPEGGWYVLGGFLSTEGNWQQFSMAWASVLRQEPAIDYFKMSEAHNLNAQFDGWPAPLRDRKVLELAEVAEQYAVARLACVVNADEYKSHIKGVSPWQELDDPYFLLFYQCIVLTARFIGELEKRHYPDLDFNAASIEFVFDEQGKVGQNALGWWDVLRQALEPSLDRFLNTAPTFGSDRSLLPLQAADLYAWHARHVFAGGNVNATRTAAVINVLQKVPPYGGHVTAEQMRQSLPELIALSKKYRP